jgi:hypothetical protein
METIPREGVFELKTDDDWSQPIEDIKSESPFGTLVTPRTLLRSSLGDYSFGSPCESTEDIDRITQLEESKRLLKKERELRKFLELKLSEKVLLFFFPSELLWFGFLFSSRKQKQHNRSLN